MRLTFLTLALILPSLAFAQTKPLAETPPMGWNSWDSYGTTIEEKSFRTSAQWIAQHLKPFGYEYVTIDEAWYDPMPAATAGHDEHLVLDPYGRFLPAVDRFPSAAKGAALLRSPTTSTRSA